MVRDGRARRCLSIAEMRAAGMATNAAGCWISEKWAFLGLGIDQIAAIGATPYPGSALEPTRRHRTLPRGAEAVERADGVARNQAIGND